MSEVSTEYSSPTANEVLTRVHLLGVSPLNFFSPQDLEEQKKAFLSGETEKPAHTYERLNNTDFDQIEAELVEIAQIIESHSHINNKLKVVYGELIHRYILINKLMKIARQLNGIFNEQTRKDLENEYKTLNGELYGEIDKSVFNGILKKRLAGIDSEIISPSAQTIRDELDSLLPSFEDFSNTDVFVPSAETIEEAQRVALILYGNLISHVPDRKEKFVPEEIRTIFETILHTEFGGAADDWQVVVDNSTTVNVKLSEKLIKIPENLLPWSSKKLKGMVAHEIGVHVLRALSGSQTRLLPMKIGFANYFDAEEGLGKVMEQAVMGKYQATGEDSYLIAGLLDEGIDFRHVYEIIWRLKLLEKTKGGEIKDEQIPTAQDYAYRATRRITRGTDYLAWHKDLAYYNGTARMWQFIESHGSDALMMMIALMGKIDPTNPIHRNAALDAELKE